jgi:antitoxin component of MazEF toxin-antitoxin module
MNISTYKGKVEKGRIKLEINVKLPEQTEVYIIVPEEKPKFDLAKMVAEMPEDYTLHEEDFGKPVGKEVW